MLCEPMNALSPALPFSQAAFAGRVFGFGSKQLTTKEKALQNEGR